MESTFFDLGIPGVSRDSEDNPKVVLGATNSPNWRTTRQAYAEEGIAPHFTITFESDKAPVVYQHVELELAAPMMSIAAPIASHRITASYWVLLDKQVGQALTPAQTAFVAEFVEALREEVGAANEYTEFLPLGVALHASRMGLGDWQQASGVLAEAQVPGLERFGPGNIDLFKVFDAEEEDEPEDEEEDEIEEPEEEEEPEDEEPEEDDEDDEEEEEDEPKDLSILGKFRGRPVTLGSGGKNVNTLREVFGLDKGKWDEDLQVKLDETVGATVIEIDGDIWAIIEEKLSGDDSDA